MMPAGQDTSPCCKNCGSEQHWDPRLSLWYRRACRVTKERDQLRADIKILETRIELALATAEGERHLREGAEKERDALENEVKQLRATIAEHEKTIARLKRNETDDPIVKLNRIMDGINSPLSCGHPVGCWDEPEGTEECAWCREIARAEKAEAEVGRLREVVKEIAGDGANVRRSCPHCGDCWILSDKQKACARDGLADKQDPPARPDGPIPKSYPAGTRYGLVRRGGIRARALKDIACAKCGHRLLPRPPPDDDTLAVIPEPWMFCPICGEPR